MNYRAILFIALLLTSAGTATVRRYTEKNHERNHMKQDMAETTNVARQNPAVVARIAGLAIDSFKNGRTNSGPARPNSCSEPQIELLTRLSTLTKGHE